MWRWLFLVTFFFNNSVSAGGRIKCHVYDNNNHPTYENITLCRAGYFCYRTYATAMGCTNDESTCKNIQDLCQYNPGDRCCCKTNLCNAAYVEPISTRTKASISSTTISLLVVGIGLFVTLIALSAIILYCKCRKKKNPPPTALTPDQNKLITPISEALNTQSVSYRPEPGTEKLIVHEDRTGEHIEPVMNAEEKQELIKSISTPEEIEGQEEFDASPRLSKLVTYATTDNITLIEEYVQISRESTENDVGFCENLLAEMINNGPREFPFDVTMLKRALKAAARVFKEECSLVEVKVPCIIYGDIHGQYSDLMRWLNLNGWPNRQRCVFLGDFVDRGSHGVEVIAMICCLKVIYPKNIFICRGNHEEENLNKAYSFYDEVRNRFKDSCSKDNIYDSFKEVFFHLPLAALIGQRILGMHGGISPKLACLQDIRDIKRPISDFEVGSLACDLVWSDPDTTNAHQNFRPNFDREPKSGIGQLFSADAVVEVCEKLNVVLIIRGHQAPLHGYAQWARGHLITLFSAPGYKGTCSRNVNMGACIEAPASGDLIIKQIKVTEAFRLKRIQDIQRRHKQIKRIV